MRIGRFLLSLGIASLAACSLFTAPVDLLDVEVSVSPTVFRLGDTARVVVTVTNPRLHPLHATAKERCGGTYFEVSDSDGNRVSGWKVVCRWIPHTFSIGAQEQFKVEITWFGEPWDGSRPDGPYPIEYLEPGSYTVRGVFEFDGERKVSEPVSVELLPRN
jgi:hypothetical protein